MKHARIYLTLLLALLATALHAQDRGPWAKYVDRLEGFGRMIPQEKVYIHMDNTCYFLGDSIWFKAYLRQTNTDKPSSYSGTLYVELLNHDGYLMERKILEMKNGEGDGYFALKTDSTMYPGFYELRAYTRWQLNWGEYEHEHPSICKDWFFSDLMSREFFRDYEKLYSRVFPVYNKPIEPGEYYLDMTMRPLQRFYKPDEKAPKLTLTLFPEGGNLVAGVQNRVAYEAQRADGEYLKGNLVIKENETAPALNRGRGVFEITPEKGMERSVEFVTEDGERVKAKLPKAEDKGVALSVQQEGDEWVIHPNITGLPIDSLALTIMNEGKLSHFKPLAGNAEFRVKNVELSVGVNQVTVFDTEGRVWADRLFFVASDKPIAPTINITGTKNVYDPYEPIKLDVQSTAANASIVSLAVREARGAIRNYDTGNILTEMLLSSEIRGFVPDPCWFFKADDIEHRQALDLLMMTQGWRRFNWKDMAVKGEWEFVHPAEKTPILTGAVHNFTAYENVLNNKSPTVYRHSEEVIVPMVHPNEQREMRGNSSLYRNRGPWEWRGKAPKKNIRADTLQVTKEMRKRMAVDGEKRRREVKVHVEYAHEGSMTGMISETKTKERRFVLTQPRFFGTSRLNLSASDTTEWSREERKGEKKHSWVVSNPNTPPEFYIRMSYVYPRFPKPYTHYMTKTRLLDFKDNGIDVLADDTHQMEEVSVTRRRRGLSSYKNTRPVVHMDAHDAFNQVVDAGLMLPYLPDPRSHGVNAHEISSQQVFTYGLARLQVASMGIRRAYTVNEMDMGKMIWNNFSLTTAMELPELGSKAGKKNSMTESKAYHGGSPDKRLQGITLRRLDSIYVITDYSPRMEGDKRYVGANQPEVNVMFKPFEDGASRRAYRDRYITLPGFAIPVDFYNPDYSRQTPPEGEKKDYRRTLYWNPRLKLDEQGHAHVTLYNNSRQTTIVAEAEGQSPDGQLLWSK